MKYPAVTDPVSRSKKVDLLFSAKDERSKRSSRGNIALKSGILDLIL
jgi:hypothetical protein